MGRIYGNNSARPYAKSVDFVTKSAPHTSLGLQLAGLDIISIEPRPETSEEPSRSPGDDDITSRYLLPVLESISPWCVKPLKWARYMGKRLYLAGLDIRSIESRHETSAEPSKPPGNDGITSRYLLPVHTRSTPEGAKSVNL
jgi:hypothetical protein